MRPEQTNPTIVGVIPRQATVVMQKETCIKNTSMVNCTKKHPGQKHDTIYQEKCGSQYILHYLHYYCRSIQRIRVRTHKHRFGNSMHLPYPKIHFRSLFQSQAEIQLKYSSQMVTLISECTCPTLNMVQAS